LTAGLYGALLVVEPGQFPDAAIDHVYVIGQGPDEEKDPILLNGVGELPSASWRIGSPAARATGSASLECRPCAYACYAMAKR
jgi:hypothetical protein